MARASCAESLLRYWINSHAAAWCVLLALTARSSPPSEACGLPVASGNGTQPVLPKTGAQPGLQPLPSESAKMYGQFSANGVCPESQASCTWDSSQVETALGAMWYL